MRRHLEPIPLKGASNKEKKAKGNSNTSVIEASKRALKTKIEKKGTLKVPQKKGDDEDSKFFKEAPKRTREEEGATIVQEEQRPSKHITNLFKKAKHKNADKDSEIIKFLKEKKDFNYRGKYGETALHWAAFHANISLLNRLVQYGADVDAQDEENQRTPLMWAALRILHDVKEYLDIINALHDRKADPSIRDHRGKNVTDILMSLSNIQGNVGFLDRFNISIPGLALSKPSEYLKPDSDAFELHGDDSSDEDETHKDDYDAQSCCDHFLGEFKSKHSQLKITDDNLKLVFAAHAVGISYLYSRPVNAFYYKNQQGKRSFGKNSFLFEGEHQESEGKIRKWLSESLFKAIQTVVYFDKNIPEKEAKRIKIIIDGKQDEEHASPKGVVSDLVKNYHFLLKKANLTESPIKLRNFNREAFEKKFKDKEKKDFLKKRRVSNKKLVGKKTDTVIANSPGKVSTFVAEKVSPESPEGNKLPNVQMCMSYLKEKLGITPLALVHQPDVGEDKDKQPVEKRNSEMAQELGHYFILHFYNNLRELQRKYRIGISRGLNESIVHNFSEHHENSLSWFNGIRKMNRFQKRKIKHHVERHFVSLPVKNEVRTPQEIMKAESLKYYIHTFSLWVLPSKKPVRFKEAITTNLLRTSFVEFDTVSSSTYPELSKHIEGLKLKHKNFVTDKFIAEYIRATLQGKKPLCESEEVADFISELAYLLFFCETSRNPASFILHQMLLDLIINERMTWKDAFSGKKQFGGGMMPMSMEGAVGSACYLHKCVMEFMPFPYRYEGDENNNLANMVELINRTSEVTKLWLSYFKFPSKNIDVNSLFSLWFTRPDWYQLNIPEKLEDEDNQELLATKNKMG